jgi:hypothetical protein
MPQYSVSFCKIICCSITVTASDQLEAEKMVLYGEVNESDIEHNSTEWDYVSADYEIAEDGTTKSLLP